MVDERRARIRRNMARAWAYAAAAHARSLTISWDLYGNPVGMAGGSVSATLSTPPSSGPALVSIGTDLSISPVSNRNVTASISVGTASANRRVFLVGYSQRVFNQNAVAISIGGVAATIHVSGAVDSAGDQWAMGVIASAVVPSGTVVGCSISWSDAVSTNAFVGRIFTADNSLFANPSPAVASTASLTVAPSTGLSLTLTASANAIMIGMVRGRTAVVQRATQTSNVAVTTKIEVATAFAVDIMFANSVTAGVLTYTGSPATATDGAAIAMLVWR